MALSLASDRDDSRLASRRFGRFLVWIALVSNALVIGMAATVLALSYQQYEIKAVEASRQRLSALSKTMEMRVERYQVSLALMSADLEAQLAQTGRLNPDRVESMIHRLNASYGGSYKLRVTDAQGWLRHGIGSDILPRISYSDRPYFQELQAHPELPMVMSPLLIGRASGVKTIVFARAYRAPSGAFAGVIIAAATESDFSEIASAYQIASDDSVVIRDARDMSLIARVPALASSLPAKPGEAPYRIPPSIQSLLASGARSGHASVLDASDRQRREASFRRLDSAPIFLMAGLGRQSFFAPWRAQLWTALLFCSLFLIGSLFLSRKLFLYHRAMLDAQASHRRLNSSLEQQIQERTADLSDALERLRLGREELEASERLASLGGMVSTIAHELNTPLGNALLASSTIVNCAQSLSALLQDGARSIKRSELQSHLDRIAQMSLIQAQSIERSASLVSSFKQVAVDQSSERVRSFPLKETLESLLVSMAPSLARAPHPMSVHLEVPDSIVCDSQPGALIQIASNLIQNAQVHAFDRRSGSLWIRASEDLSDPAHPWISIDFEDDGEGIPLEAQAHLFESFFTTKAHRGGSGIGLSLSRDLARRSLGGDLSVVSEPGGGARFHLRFPRKKP